MIRALRADDNLLHGQIAFGWVRSLHLHRIIIADDTVVKDEFTKMTLGFSKPSGILLSFMTIRDAVRFIQEDRSQMNVMIIVNSIRTAYAVLTGSGLLRTLNIGLLRPQGEIVAAYDLMALDEKDVALCRQLLAKGIQLEYRLRCDDAPVLISDLLAGRGHSRPL
jgi:fructoselysine and glucoselysine-specific PTS system IIB component